MDNALSVLGPELAKAKKAALAAWSVKFALMLQLVYPRTAGSSSPTPTTPSSTLTGSRAT